MTPIEKLDLEILKTKATKEKLDAFEMCVEYLRMDDKALANCGHKSRESAMFHTIKIAHEENQRRMRAHIKKYPDAT